MMFMAGGSLPLRGYVLDRIGLRAYAATPSGWLSVLVMRI